MNAQTEHLLQDGPAGTLEIAIDRVPGARGAAVIAHPHPLHGGTLSNKVVQTLARASVLAGWSAVRFNFRGVGCSAGAYDEGLGELEDLLAVVNTQVPQGIGRRRHLAAQPPDRGKTCPTKQLAASLHK